MEPAANLLAVQWQQIRNEIINNKNAWGKYMFKEMVNAIKVEGKTLESHGITNVMLRSKCGTAEKTDPVLQAALNGMVLRFGSGRI